MNKRPQGDSHDAERHINTRVKIKAELAKQYQKDFPDKYYEENMNMDRLFELWHEEFDARLVQILHDDIEKNGDRNYVTLYESATTDEEREQILNVLKKHLY